LLMMSLSIIRYIVVAGFRGGSSGTLGFLYVDKFYHKIETAMMQ
jgi:hypothetical protein